MFSYKPLLKWFSPFFKRALICGVILGFLPFGLSSMAIKYLLMINNMNAILFLPCKIISHQRMFSYKPLLKWFSPFLKRALICGVILGFFPFGLSSMAIKHLLMINSMNAILFLPCKIISHQRIWSQIMKRILLLLCKIISY
jgi:uncharacterized protein (DUF2062 family)